MTELKPDLYHQGIHQRKECHDLLVQHRSLDRQRHNEGEIHTYKSGTVTLVVTLKYNGELLRIRREIKLTVDNKPYPVDIEFDSESVSFSIPFGLLFDIRPSGCVIYSDGSREYADGKNIIFTSSNESVATVNSKGTIRAISLGETTITATTADGEFTKTCQVTVGPDWLPPLPKSILRLIIRRLEPAIKSFRHKFDLK